MLAKGVLCGACASKRCCSAGQNRPLSAFSYLPPPTLAERADAIWTSEESLRDNKMCCLPRPCANPTHPGMQDSHQEEAGPSRKHGFRAVVLQVGIGYPTNLPCPRWQQSKKIAENLSIHESCAPVVG